MDRNLFWTKLEAEHPRAEAFCRKLTGKIDDGDDLYQEALILAFSQCGKLRQESSFRPWLYRIIVNKYKSNCRRLKWLKLVDFRSEERPEKAHDPSEKLSARVWLNRAFKALSAEERALISLYELESWSISELAAMYAKPEGTIKSKLARAREKMRRELSKYLSPETNERTITEAEYALPRNKTSLE